MTMTMSDAAMDAPAEVPDAATFDSGAEAADAPVVLLMDALVDGQADTMGGTGAVYACPTANASATDLVRCTSDPQFIGQVGAGLPLGKVLRGDLSPDGSSLFVLTHLPELPENLFSLIRIDLLTGERVLISGYDAQQVKRGSGAAVEGDVKVSAAGKIFSNSSQQLLQVDPLTGDTTTLAQWRARTDLCRFTEGAFALHGEDTLFLGHTSFQSRGWLRFDKVTDTCTAFSWCRMSTAVEAGGEGPCPGDAPRPLLFHDGSLWSSDFLRGAIFTVNPTTGLRRFASRTTSDPTQTVGAGDGCLRVHGAPADPASFAVLGRTLWMSGDVVQTDDCDPGDADLAAIDMDTGDRIKAMVASGPLAGAAGDDVGMIWPHPTLPGVLLVSASGGIAVYDPASGRSVYISR